MNYNYVGVVERYIGYLKKEMKERGYNNDYIEMVITDFRDDYDYIMSSNVEQIYDYWTNGSLNYRTKYVIEDFGDDDDLYDLYLDAINVIIDYCLRFINRINRLPDCYKVEFSNGETVKIVFMSNYTDITPLKELYNRFIDKGGE